MYGGIVGDCRKGNFLLQPTKVCLDFWMVFKKEKQPTHDSCREFVLSMLLNYINKNTPRVQFDVASNAYAT